LGWLGRFQVSNLVGWVRFLRISLQRLGVDGIFADYPFGEEFEEQAPGEGGRFGFVLNGACDADWPLW